MWGTTSGNAYKSFPNSQDQTIVDLQRGIVVDSRAMNPEQFTRYFRNQKWVKRPDLNLRQADEYFKDYVLGQRLLYAQQEENIKQISRFVRLSSPEFVAKYWLSIFGPTYAQTMKYISQRKGCGYMRSQYDIEKIAKYAQRTKNSLQELGLLRKIGKTYKNREEEIEQIKKNLRSKYIKPRVAPEEAAAEE